MRNFAKWLLLFIPALLVELACYILNPLVAIFTRKEERTDRAKILGGVVTMQRDYLIKPLMYFQSHDNAVDEWHVANTPLPDTEPTPEQIIARLEGAIDRYLDEQAQSLRYESIRTLVTYINDPNPKFNAEGIAGLNLRSAVYTQAIGIIDDVQNGLREIPTEAELIAELPKIEDFLQY